MTQHTDRVGTQFVASCRQTLQCMTDTPVKHGRSYAVLYGRPIDEYVDNIVELSSGALCKYPTNDMLRSIAGRCCTAYRRDVTW